MFMKYEYCIFLNEIKVSKIFQTLDAAIIELKIKMAAYKEIDPDCWHIACRGVSDWHFKEDII